ncbi:hypothetical protein [Microbacterium sp. 22296]|uniref:hypothetical protein n=1 Tax=Microbacterium sp. 22296 TaxID=3453903 RepID=UPI003F87F17C
MQTPPWSTNQLKKLSRSIRDETPTPEGGPEYPEVMLWYNDVAIEVQESIEALDWSEVLGAAKPEITSRPKTIDTLREKLRRDPGTPLPSVQDVAGVRFEAEMSLEQQDDVARIIGAHFDHGSEAVRDLRVQPHSGYRALHLWLRLPAKVEIQIRTHLQGQWANTYEAAADLLGRDIRYGVLPEGDAEAGLVRMLQELSTGAVAQMEAYRAALPGLEAMMRQLRTASANLDRSTRRQVEESARLYEEAKATLRETEAEFSLRMDFAHAHFRGLRLG